MIHIITGPVDCGKTTRLLALYRAQPGGDGFILPKFYQNGAYAGQRIVHLRSGLYHDFSRTAGCIPANWDENARFGNHHFSKSGLEFARQIIAEGLCRRCSPLFIDEIGPLELAGGGISELLPSCAAGCELYAAVRSACLDAVIRRFFGDQSIRITACGVAEKKSSPQKM